MNTLLLKQISILSLFLGGALGIVTLIPFIGEIAFWLLMCLSSTAVMLFMIHLEMLDIQTVQESAILGAIIGFVSFVGFSIFYIPITVILAKVFQLYTNYGIAISLSNASFGLIIVLVIFMGILCATVNAFSGFLTFYGNDFYNTIKKNNDNNKFNGGSNGGI